jgi:putative flavoprotein involved in K+ transport
VSHLIVERQRIAERWRSERWDSLVANGPAWHDRFPGMTFAGIDADSFATKHQIVDYFEAYAQKNRGADSLRRRGASHCRKRRTAPASGPRPRKASSTAAQVVVATGPFQRPIVPQLIPSGRPAWCRLHSSAYRNPAALPEGAVLVIGAGSSGSQIADELARAGRQVYLSVGPHNRPPRRYRGRDFVWWLGALGEWDAKAASAGTEHVTIAVSGARGGHTVDFRELASRGVTLLGNAGTYQDGTLQVAPNLAKNIANGDANYLSVLKDADAYVRERGLDLPEEPEAHVIAADPPCLTHPILELNLAAAGITSVIWATGYAMDFGWLKVDAFDAKGRPAASARRVGGTGVVLCGLVVAVTACITVHLGGVARRGVSCGRDCGPDRGRCGARGVLRLRDRAPAVLVGKGAARRAQGCGARQGCGACIIPRCVHSVNQPDACGGCGRGADRGDVRRRCGGC